MVTLSFFPGCSDFIKIFFLVHKAHIFISHIDRCVCILLAYKIPLWQFLLFCHRGCFFLLSVFTGLVQYRVLFVLFKLFSCDYNLIYRPIVVEYQQVGIKAFSYSALVYTKHFCRSLGCHINRIIKRNSALGRH